MKINHFQKTRLLAALLSPFVIVSCADRFDDPAIVPPGDRLPFEFGASIEQDNSSRADESGFADGDRFGAYVVNYDAGEPGTLALTGNQVNNVAIRFSAESASWTAASGIYWRDSSTPVDVYGYYPFNNGLGDVETYRFEVRPDQSIPAADGDMGAYEASDFLWAKAARVTPGTKINLPFTHRLAGVKVTLQKGAGFTDEEWEKLPRIVSVDNTVRTASIDLSTGVATPSGSFDRNVVMNPDAPDSYRAVVVPQTVAAGRSTIGITVDGVNYAYTRDGGMTYTAGKLHAFTLRVDKKEQGGAYTVTLVGESILPWEADSSSHDFEANSYLVVNCPEAGKLKECIAAADIDLSTIKNIKVTGQLTEEDFRVMREEMVLLTFLNLKEAKMKHISYKVPVDGLHDWEFPIEYMDDMFPNDAFSHNKSIRRIILPDNIVRIGSNALANTQITTTIVIPESVSRIDNGAFSSIEENATIVLPSSLEYIAGGSFYGCSANFELKLSDKLKYIGDDAFWDTPNATGVLSLPSELEYLGEGSFQSCGHDLIGELVIPEKITEIPNGAFSNLGVRNGISLVFHPGVTKIGDNAFGNHLNGIKFTNQISFPENLKYIGFAAFRKCKFVGTMNLPENIEYIAPSAFANTNYSGDLNYPSSLNAVVGGVNEFIGSGDDFGGPFRFSSISSLTLDNNILQVGMAAFEGCQQLKSIRIGKNVNFIGERAFNDCVQLELVVCLSKEPPQLGNNAFRGFWADKCILEVPEESIDLYRNANGWSQFRSITAHHELAFNIKDIACLDRGVTRTGILRAEGPWHVSGCPDWVHVSPVSGDYKDEITITVDSQSAGSESREGLIEFTLDGKDYATSTSVRQLATPGNVGEDTEIMLQTASAVAPAEIPVFIVGEGFTADQIASGDYMTRMEQTMNDLFAIEPYKSMSNYFTVSTSFACSPDEGTGDVETIKINCFDTNGVTPDITKLRDYVTRVSPTHAGGNLPNALIIVVSNYNAFAGWSSIEDDGCAIAGIGVTDDVYPYDQRGLVQHHAGGAAFAGLGNEEVTHFTHIKGCTCPNCNALSKFKYMKDRGLFENLTMSGKMNDAPWRDFIFHHKYSQATDMWEGGYNHFRGVWRSESQSVMSTYIPYYNTISRYAIYKGIMRRAGLFATLDDFIANDKIEIPY